MGIYLNPENEGFRETVRSEIYVDKTGLIALTNRYMNTKQKYICVSRSRRFGKSMALEGYAGEILLVGISYNRENRNKPHSCIIERAEETGTYTGLFSTENFCGSRKTEGKHHTEQD